jgi:hypothetical protein
VAASACCGSAPPAQDQCCDPVAREEAIADGASCCGAAAEEPRVAVKTNVDLPLKEVFAAGSTCRSKVCG